MELRIVKAIALVALWMGATVGLRAQTVVEYIHTDALGTPVAVTNAAGMVIERSEYEPYGKLVNRPLTDGPGFTGHVQDAATGLTYMQQRYYDPVVGRFLSADPIAANPSTGANFNRYWYADNNPYRYIDPDGRGIKDWAEGQKQEIKDDWKAVQQILSGNWKGAVENGSIRVGWTAPDNGVGSGTLQVGFEHGRPAVDLNVGWGAAGGKGADVKTDWISTKETAGQPRAWFGGNLAARLNVGPLRAKFVAADGNLVIAPGSGAKGYSEKTGFDAKIKPSQSLSMNASAGGFIRIGFVAPSNVLYPEKED